MTGNAAIVNRAMEEWNKGNLDGYLSVYSPDIRLHGYTPEALDHAGAVAFYRDAIWGAFPGAKLSFEDVMEVGDRVVIRFVMTGVHEGPFMGVPPTGKAIALPGITILQFRDGKCVERWSNADMLGVLIQIGAVRSPA